MLDLEFIGLIISLILTLMVFSYIFGDNPLFKLAEHIFVGVSIGYAILVAWYQVLLPILNSHLTDTLSLMTRMPAALLCLLLIFKVNPTQTRLGSALGSISLAFLIGLGAALSIGGALFGTLGPQMSMAALFSLTPQVSDLSTEQYINELFSNLVVLIGTLGAFFYFTFTYHPQGPLSGVRRAFVDFFAVPGRWIILITLGALFANTVSSRVALFASRLQFLADGFQQLSGR